MSFFSLVVGNCGRLASGVGGDVLKVACRDIGPNPTLVSKPKLAVSGDTSAFIVCGADVTTGADDMGSRSDRVIMRSAGILC